MLKVWGVSSIIVGVCEVYWRPSNTYSHWKWLGLPYLSSLLMSTLTVFPCDLWALVICGQIDVSGSGRCPYICLFEFIWNNTPQLGAPPCTTLKCFLYFRASVSSCLVGGLLNMISSLLGYVPVLTTLHLVWQFEHIYSLILINCYIKYLHHPQLILVGGSLRRNV